MYAKRDIVGGDPGHSLTHFTRNSHCHAENLWTNMLDYCVYQGIPHTHLHANAHSTHMHKCVHAHTYSSQAKQQTYLLL